MTTQDLEAFRGKVKDDYWEKYKDRGNRDEDRWHCYIEGVLPEELRLASEQLIAEDILRLPQDAREVLVMLVGYQLEPLLQAICAWRPKKVVMVLNQWYGDPQSADNSGQSWGNFIAERIEQIVSPSQQHLLNEMPLVGRLYLRDEANTSRLAQPANVFRCLRNERIEWDEELADSPTIAELIQQHGKRQIIFDITGGKKSMVAGAYLFCAYADLTVSYVDFDDEAYEPKYSRPYGDACLIGEMENPYELFGLRNWQRVEELYRRHAFKAARIEVERLLPLMRKGFFTDREIEATNKLLAALRVYELWDHGDHYEANQQLSTLTWFTPPKVVSELCNETPQWPNVASLPTTVMNQEDAAGNIKDQVITLAIGINRDLAASFYKQARLLHYAEDELARANRLKERGDYRTAYLRAYGVYEVLIKARLIRQLASGGSQIVQPTSAASGLSLDQKKELAEALRRYSGLGEMMSALNDKIELNRGMSRVIWRITPADRLPVVLEADLSIPPRVNFWADSAGNPLPEHPLTEDTMTELRNQIAHFCLWIPENLAEACIKCARANLNDFKTHWLPATTDPKDYEPLPWEDLCDQCGLDFLLPMNK